MVVPGRAKVLGVIGHPVGHSLSPVMHNAAIEALGLDCIYVPFDVTHEDLPKALCGIRALGIAGVNVTIPHKEAVIGLLDEVEGDASEIGSVNTVANIGGKLIGSSTDGAGFIRSIEEAGFSPNRQRAVVLGTGGSARAVAFALAKAGAELTVLGRSIEKAERLAKDIKITGGWCEAGDISGLGSRSLNRKIGLLVNCTPVGMHPKPEEMAVPVEVLQREMLVCDLVYNPVRTRLLEAAEAAGAQTLGGLDMLVYQGALSFEVWIGKKPPIHIMKTALLKAVGQQ